jgi:hypothetical protein
MPAKKKKPIASEKCRYKKVADLLYLDQHGHRVIAMTLDRCAIIEDALRKRGEFEEA